MRAARRVVMCLGCCLSGLAVVPVMALAEGALLEDSPHAEGSGGSSVLGGALVIAGSPTEGEERRARSEAKRDSPEAFVVRYESRTKYEDLGVHAAGVDRTLFPGLVERQAAGMPRLPDGVQLVRYNGPTTAQLDLPSGKHGALESTSVIAKPIAGGRYAPVDLGLERSGKGYRPKSPAVAVSIPEQLNEGVTAPASGVSLVPTNSRGVPLHAQEGSLQGASVLYANVETDTDAVAKPTSAGFELDAILRSERSPRTLYYKVRMPHGAHLVQRPSGQAEVTDDRHSIGYIPLPAAGDASGATVSVTMSVYGDMFAIRVDSAMDEVQWPIEVDPEYSADDSESPGHEACPGSVECNYGMHNWEFITSNSQVFESQLFSNLGIAWRPVANFSPSEYAGVQYETKGESRIWAFEAKVYRNYFGGEGIAESVVGNIDIIRPNGNGGYESENERPVGVALEEKKICGEHRQEEWHGKGGPQEERERNEHRVEEARTENRKCEPTEGYPGNIARYMTDTTLSGGTKSEEDVYLAGMNSGNVYVAQEKGPEVGFHITDPTVAVNGVTRPNVLYGGGSWLGPLSGGIEFGATDPGVGVSAVILRGPSSIQIDGFATQGDCQGLQCPKTQEGVFTYSPTMEEGEHRYYLTGDDQVGAVGVSTEVTVKVDATPPEELGFTGMPEKGAEISATQHTLVVHATDGKAPTPSSGVKSMQVSIDSSPLTTIPGSCSPGPCTANGSYTLDAEALSEGVHQLTITATDNARNISSKKFFFDVRHATPVSVGPGTVDPTTGQFTLTANDVSLGGASGVSRSYQSRNVIGGTAEPLGPQWALSVGGGEGLTVLPSGDVVLTSSNGGTTTFSLNTKGEFESPKGDENLKIEYKATEHKYVLKDANAGSETVFEQPSGTQSTPPTYGDAFGGEEGVLNRPVSDALDPNGNIWVTDWSDDRIAKFTSAGTLVATYGSEGSESDQLREPFGIAVNQSTGNVYVSDYGNSRIDEFSSSGSFIRAFGWGVSDGKEELETCASSCQAGIAGTGEGQLDRPDGIALDANGHVWVAEEGSNRVQEFSESGSYITSFGSAGSGAGQLEIPMDIAFVGGELYVTDQNNNRVDVFSTAGAFVKAIGWGVSNGEERLETCTSSCRVGIAGAGNGQFYAPRGLATDPISGNLYIVNVNSDCMQEMTIAGTFVTKVCAGGSGLGQFNGPMGVAVSSMGNIYIADFNNARVQEWSRSTWLPTSAKGALPNQTTYIYTPVEEDEDATSMQPYEVISPTPHGVECGTTIGDLKKEKDKGCRALTFKYATKTKAKGESEKEWGEYKGRLSQVIFHAWNPSTKAMEENTVAQYSYDKQGRLRAEWDPRIENSTACGGICLALKTTYGYDAEGHVTALTPPGQESWGFMYGTIAGDANTGRILKVTRASASTKLWSGEAPKNTGTPKLSGSPVVGVDMGVSHGSWNNSPITYGYQWSDCNSEGKSCTPILGATNENYKVASSDVGFTLVVQVTAINGGGGVTATSATSAVVSNSGTKTEGEYYPPEPGSTIEYHVPLSGPEGSDLQNLTKEKVEEWGQKDTSEYEDNDPVEGMAVFPPDEPQSWPASDYKRATIGYMNTKGLVVDTVTPSGGVSTTEYNALNEVVRTLSADNRAAAMKEGCKSLSKRECKSAEVSEKLDTKTEYNPEGSDILKVLGPEHEIKLPTGGEADARAVTRNYYDEGAREAEEKTKETYNLVTKTTSGALLSNGEEKDVRTTATSYSGQEDLGWELRKPTSTTIDPDGLDLVHKTIYTKETGDVVETRAPAGNSEVVSPPYFSTDFASEGSGNGQIKESWGDALDGSGNLWVADTANNRIEEFSSAGSFIAAYGKEGTGNVEFKEPRGIAVNQTTGDVYIADSDNGRIEELSSKGEFVRSIGTSGEGELDYPRYVTIDAAGNLWVSDYVEDRVVEFSSEGAFIRKFGSAGTGNGQFTKPAGIAISEGSVYVVDDGDDRVEQFSTTGAYIGQFGGKGKGSGQFESPYGIAANPTTGVLYVCDQGNNRMEEFSPAGKFLTEWETWGSTHEQYGPASVVVSATGKLYIDDPWVNKIGIWLSPEAGGSHLSYSTQFGSSGSGNSEFKEPVATAIDGRGDVWVTDYGNDRVEELGSDGSFIATYGTEGSGEVQFDGPAGIAINKSTGNVYVADTWNNRVEELSSSGAYVASFGTSGSGTLKEPSGVAVDSSGNIWVADRGNNRVVEFSSTGTYIAAYGKVGSGELQFNHPTAVALSGEDVYVTDSYNHRVEELTSKGAYVRVWGIEGSGSNEFYTPEGITTDSAGNVYVSDINVDHVEEFSSSGTYKATFGSLGSGEGQLAHPEGIVIDAAGDLYVVDQGNNRIQKWDNNQQAAHDTKTAYYSAKEESPVAACRNHPEWADLPCQTEPVAQPNHGLPELPTVTMTSYNIWDEAEKTEEKFGTGSKAVTRTKTETYDPAGRALTSEETASPATSMGLPKVTAEYNAETGAVEKQSTDEGTITSKDNALGQRIEYKDASGNVVKYTYEEGGDDRLEEVSEGKGEEAESSQTYSYNTTTGLMERLVDSAAGAFTASYDVEGKMTSETYPNNMTASYTINSVGQTTGLVYEKNAGCASKCPETWFSDSTVPSIHGEMLQQTSSLSRESYAYDNAGRLLETQETPTSKDCKVRVYVYEEESNRTSETTREPGSEGKCATEGGIVERHTYDEANRLTDEGVEYETFGNITRMPSVDAGGHELVSTYYVDNQVASQEQDKQLLNFKYDPLGRTAEKTLENVESKTKVTTIMHYAGSGDALTWTSEGSEKWTRNVPCIGGTLCATQEAGKAPVLQLHDLDGNIVAAAADSQSETKLLSTYNSIDFGVPNEGKTPPRYAWLGATGVSTETTLGSGVSTESGTSYVPQVARDLQTAPVVPPGAFPNGSPGTQYTATVSPATLAFAQEEATKVWQRAEAERQRAQEEEACRADPESCSEDPSWSGDVSIAAAEAISGALEGLEIVEAVGGGLAEKVLEVFAEDLDLNWLGQLKEILQKKLFGYSVEQVKHWAYTIGTLLGECASLAYFYKEPHCWLYIPTVVRHAYKGGPGFEIPNFAAPIGWNNPGDVAVGYCLWGTYSPCFNANAE